MFWRFIALQNGGDKLCGSMWKAYKLCAGVEIHQKMLFRVRTFPFGVWGKRPHGSCVGQKI